MKERVAAVMDWVALGALASAAGLLGAGLWFVDSFLTPLLFQGFGSALGIAVALFGGARIVELMPYLGHAWHNSYPRVAAAAPVRPRRLLELVSSRDDAAPGRASVTEGLDDAA